jgi:hypothetical protein
MGAAEKLDIKRDRVEAACVPWVDKRLQAWAEWLACDECGVSGIGYGNNALASIIDAKGDVIRSTGGAVGGDMPDSVYEVDRAMRKLSVSRHALHTALCEHYLHADADEAVRVARCECSRRTYFRRVAQGHSALLFLLPGRKADVCNRAAGGVKSGARDALLKSFKKQVDGRVALN